VQWRKPESLWIKVGSANSPLPGDAREEEIDCELAELEAEYQANPRVLIDEDIAPW
jgi:hypothetical protein